MANRPGTNNPGDPTTDNPLETFFDKAPELSSAPVLKDLVSPALVDQLTSLINGHSLENGSNTPDFLLSKLMMGVLVLWNKTTNERDAYFRNRSRVDGPWPTDVLELSSAPDSIGARMYSDVKGPFEITLDFSNPAKGREVLEALARTYPDALPKNITIQTIAQRRYPNTTEDSGLEA